MLQDISGGLLGFFHIVRTEILAPLGFLMAVAVTVHVLLRKRDVAAAIGWIGLAWLAPVLGSLIYFMLGVNRIRRRARAMRGDAGQAASDPPSASEPGRDDHLAPLEHAALRISRRPALCGVAVSVFHNGDEAYPPMVAAIRGATVSVALSTYILRDDAAGGPFIEALIDARRRGVAVRVLLDGIGSGYFRSPAYTRLHRNAVRVGRFMHSLLPWRMPFLNLRTHKKVLVVDGRIGFAGGMNIGAENLVATKPRKPVRDTHFRFEGPVVAQLAEAFAGDWSFVMGEDLEGPTWFPPIAEQGEGAGLATARVITSGPDQDLEKIELLVFAAIASARSSIRLMTPYFLPDERLVTALAVAQMRGVTVDILIPERSNHRLVDWATRAHVGPLLEGGCRIWRNPPPFDHSKIMVVDGEWCLIGSANWDVRSFRLNFELNVEVYHCDLADGLEAAMRPLMRHELTAEELNARSLPLRLRDAAVRLALPYL